VSERKLFFFIWSSDPWAGSLRHSRVRNKSENEAGLELPIKDFEKMVFLSLKVYRPWVAGIRKSIFDDLEGFLFGLVYSSSH
jgi:hypothetical protein